MAVSKSGFSIKGLNERRLHLLSLSVGALLFFGCFLSSASFAEDIDVAFTHKDSGVFIAITDQGRVFWGMEDQHLLQQLYFSESVYNSSNRGANTSVAWHAAFFAPSKNSEDRVARFSTTYDISRIELKTDGKFDVFCENQNFCFVADDAKIFDLNNKLRSKEISLESDKTFRIAFYVFKKSDREYYVISEDQLQNRPKFIWRDVWYFKDGKKQPLVELDSERYQGAEVYTLEQEDGDQTSEVRMIIAEGPPYHAKLIWAESGQEEPLQALPATLENLKAIGVTVDDFIRKALPNPCDILGEAI